MRFIASIRSGQIVVCRYADDLVIGCQREGDGKTLLVALKDSLAQFSLSLHEGKTRLVEFGRFAARNRQAAGLRRPETFDFLGFTHYCSETRGGRFTVKRKTQAKRMVRELKALREEMAHRCTSLSGSNTGGSAKYCAVTASTTGSSSTIDRCVRSEIASSGYGERYSVHEARRVR